MSKNSTLDNPLAHIKKCLTERKIVWTYHINMRLTERSIDREEILNSIDTLEIIEEYLENRYLPSYLLYALSGKKFLHIVVAADVTEENIRIITAYEPDPSEWNGSLKRRRKVE